VALELARLAGGEIINFDSIQLYRGFDIGSAKPRAADRAAVPHHLYDIVEGDEEVNAALFSAMARQTIEEVAGRGRLPILVGGTGFYLRAILYGLPEMPGKDESLRQRLRSISGRPRGAARLHALLHRLDPVSGARIEAADRHRVERALEVALLTGKPISAWERPDPQKDVKLFPALSFAITMPRPLLAERLDQRVDAMYSEGLIEETRALLERYPRSSRPFSAIGYREAVAVLDGTLATAAAVEKTRGRTRAYAKRQITWLRGETGIHWIEQKGTALETAVEILQILKRDHD
jgi:tRNA dimethylallyltransferase